MNFLTVDAPHLITWQALIGAGLGPLLGFVLWRRLGRDLVGYGVMAVFTFGYLCAVWAFLIEPRTLVVRQVTVTSAQWRGPPLRLGVVSDTHAGQPQITPERVGKIMQRLNAEHPDVVVFLGDYIGGHAAMADRSARDRDQVERGQAALGEAQAPLGRVAVLGNHDWWSDGSAGEAVLRRAGLTVLENNAVRIARPSGAFWIAGVADPESRRAAPSPEKALRNVPPKAPVIMLMHQPDSFPGVPPRVALSLAGHTHCGQVRLPFVGALVVPSAGSRRWTCGLYNESGRQIFVTGGVGTSGISVRFMAPPEVVILTLKAP